MTNGSYRYRHFDNLSGDAVTAELFGVRRLMSCDSVRRNLKAIPMEDMKQRRKEPPHREFAQLTIPGLELVTVNDGMYADGYEWYALVTGLDLGPRAVSQLYRDRGDCENIFDEMKNHYGWGGFVTQDMKGQKS